MAYLMALFCTTLTLGLEKTPLVQAAETKIAFETEVESTIRKQGAELLVPGYAFGLIVDGKVVLRLTEGRRALSKESKVDSQTLFQIGSIAKTFSATTAVKLNQKKSFSLDDLIEKHLPERCKPKRCTGIKVRHLLSHSSGIPSRNLNRMIEDGESFDTVAKAALKAPRLCPPGKCYQYNNVAFELTREIIEKVTGQSYFEILKREILIPLNIKNIPATLAELISSGNYFTPHLFQNSRYKETNHSKPYYQLPGSSVLNVNLDDMLTFALAELGQNPEVISSEMLQILHTPVIEAPDVYEWFDSKPGQRDFRSDYGIGHRLINYQGLKIAFHTGWIKGSKSVMVVYPEKKIGFVVLQNAGSPLILRALENISKLVLKMK